MRQSAAVEVVGASGVRGERERERERGVRERVRGVRGVLRVGRSGVVRLAESALETAAGVRRRGRVRVDSTRTCGQKLDSASGRTAHGHVC